VAGRAVSSGSSYREAQVQPTRSRTRPQSRRYLSQAWGCAAQVHGLCSRLQVQTRSNLRRADGARCKGRRRASATASRSQLSAHHVLKFSPLSRFISSANVMLFSLGDLRLRWYCSVNSFLQRTLRSSRCFNILFSVRCKFSQFFARWKVQFQNRSTAFRSLCGEGLWGRVVQMLAVREWNGHCATRVTAIGWLRCWRRAVCFMTRLQRLFEQVWSFFCWLEASLITQGSRCPTCVQVRSVLCCRWPFVTIGPFLSQHC